MIPIDDSQVTLGYTMAPTNPTIWLLGLGFYGGLMTWDFEVTI